MKTRWTLGTFMTTSSNIKTKEGKVGWALLWLMGVPVPVLLFFFLLRGCT
jgi:hypothetical protein